MEQGSDAMEQGTDTMEQGTNTMEQGTDATEEGTEDTKCTRYKHKKLSDAYIASVFGIFGAHHFYLGRKKFGYLYLFTLGLFGIGFIFDLFRMKWIVHHVNHRPKDEVLTSDVWIICLVLGPMGGHHFYLGNVKLGCYYAFTLGSSGVGWILDLMRIELLTDERKRKDAYYRGRCQALSNYVEARASRPLPGDLAEVYDGGPYYKRKSLITAYILAVPPFGMFGPYHYYLGNTTRFYVHACTFGLCGVGWLLDLFQMFIMVCKSNDVRPDVKHIKRSIYGIALSPLGILGAHHFVMGRRWNGTFYLFTCGCLGMGWVLDWLRLPVLVSRYADNDRHKYVDDAYMYWLPFGIFGLHQFYLGRTKWGLFYLCTLGCLGVGWAVDGYRMIGLVREANQKIKGKARNKFAACNQRPEASDTDRPEEININTAENSENIRNSQTECK